mgnify:CR=1 FL=1
MSNVIDLSYSYRVSGWSRIKQIDPTAHIITRRSDRYLVVQCEVPFEDSDLSAYLSPMGWTWNLESLCWSWRCPLNAIKKDIKYARSNEPATRADFNSYACDDDRSAYGYFRSLSRGHHGNDLPDTEIL